jgi:hypothetical protein
LFQEAETELGETRVTRAAPDEDATTPVRKEAVSALQARKRDLRAAFEVFERNEAQKPDSEKQRIYESLRHMAHTDWRVKSI